MSRQTHGDEMNNHPPAILWAAIHMEEAMEAEDKKVDSKIRRLAEKNNLVASRGTVHGPGGAVDSKWFFADQYNALQSPEDGLFDDEALEYLK